MNKLLLALEHWDQIVCFNLSSFKRNGRHSLSIWVVSLALSGTTNIKCTWRRRVSRIVVLLNLLSVVVSVWQWWSCMIDVIHGGTLAWWSDGGWGRGCGAVIDATTGRSTGPFRQVSYTLLWIKIIQYLTFTSLTSDNSSIKIILCRITVVTC